MNKATLSAPPANKHRPINPQRTRVVRLVMTSSQISPCPLNDRRAFERRSVENATNQLGFERAFGRSSRSRRRLFV